MKLSGIAGLLLLLPSFASGQQQPDRIKINSLQPNAYLEGYLYPAFGTGRVYEKDGSYGQAKLNFNRLTNEMVFIAPKGDTMKLAHPESASLVTILSDSFYFYQGTFLRKATHYAQPPELYQKLEMKYVSDENKSAYGYSDISAKTSVQNFNTYFGTTFLPEDKNIKFEQSRDLYILNDKGVFVAAKETVLFKMFPQYKNRLREFLSEHKINFRKPQDAAQAIDFIQKIMSPAAE
ncbi:hypothetical protein [Taibaiella chishuiensis]|uniref:Uncharacterized protein n=1 Tax=Taibaiella chishuiensis TaxID=1434707 RepID=A0A2P8D353_9BACT|nr:hypothetical protein [Taibaiella chishuiensis]PSK91606.1 hypothetical protein B0I18_105191 [Taibaiella chishuiensis]